MLPLLRSSDERRPGLTGRDAPLGMGPSVRKKLIPSSRGGGNEAVFNVLVCIQGTSIEKRQRGAAC